jgi:hypothetical protein
VAIKLKISKAKRFDEFSAAIRGLAEMTGKPLETVIDHEVARVLELTMDKMKVATSSRIIRDHEAQQMLTTGGSKGNPQIAYGGPESKSNRQKTLTNLVVRAALRRADAKKGMFKFALPAFTGGARKGIQGAGKHRHPSWLWNEITRRREASLRKKLSARGVAAAHFLQIAKLLRLKVRARSEVVNAKAAYDYNVGAYRDRKSGGYYVIFRNSNTTSVKWAGGQKAVFSAVQNRVNAYGKAVDGFAKTHIRALASQYPALLRAA